MTILESCLRKNTKKPAKTVKVKNQKRTLSDMLVNPLRLNIKNDILTRAKKHTTQAGFEEVFYVINSYLKKHKISIEEYVDFTLDYYNDFNPIDHTQRVLTYATYIAIQEKMSENCVRILINAAKLHDIGRNSDATDLLHGHKGATIIKDYSLVDFDKKELNMLLSIVDSHSAYDKNIEGVLYKYDVDVNDYKMVKKMCNILKDAEALDKARFIDNTTVKADKLINVSMLKSKASIALVTFAFSLVEYYNKNANKQ